MLFGKTTFVVFEGVDGSGKSTLIKAVTDKLAEDGQHKFVTMREPDCQSLPKLNEVLRGTLADENIDPVSEILLHGVYRRENVDKIIKPNIDNKVSVISDRFALTTWCFNVYPFKDSNPALADLFMGLSPFIFGEGLPEPLTFYLDTPLDVCRERLLASGKPLDRYESNAEYQAMVAEGYSQIAQSPSVAVLDGTKTIDELVVDVLAIIEAHSLKQLVEIETMREELDKAVDPATISEEPEAADLESEPANTLTVEEAANDYVTYILSTLHRISVQSHEDPAPDEFHKYKSIIKEILAHVLEGLDDPIGALTTDEGRSQLGDQIIPVIAYKHRYGNWEKFLASKSKKAE